MAVRRLLVIAAAALVAAVRADGNEAKEMYEAFMNMACDCHEKNPLDKMDAEILLTFKECGDDRTNLQNFLQCLGENSGLCGEDRKPSPDICTAVAEKLFSKENKEKGESACKDCINKVPGNDPKSISKIWNNFIKGVFPELNEEEESKKVKAITAECVKLHEPEMGSILKSAKDNYMDEKTACFYGCGLARSGGISPEAEKKMLEAVPDDKKEETKKAIDECRESAPKEGDCEMGNHYNKCFKEKGLTQGCLWG